MEKSGTPYLSRDLDIRQNSDRGVSNIQISSQFLIKENWQNSRTSDDIDMKLGLVAKRDEINKATSKIF